MHRVRDGASSARPRRCVSEGQRQLIDAAGTYDELQRRVGASRQSLLDWRQGDRPPQLVARRRLLDALGIPIEAWDQPWREPQPDAPDEAAPPAPPPAPPPVPVTVGGTTIDQCLALLNVIRVDRVAPNLLPSERVKLVDSEGKLLKLLAELQTRAELTEDRYVREHPAWIRARNAIADALKPHPAAAQAVASVLDRLGL
jgi:transcriptional regulator with XRE-family HTH domain